MVRKEPTLLVGEYYQRIKDERYAKEHGAITNKAHRELTDVTDRTALRDLKELIDRNIFRKQDKKS
jgi:predicted HTH transcriptional regulator